MVNLLYTYSYFIDKLNIIPVCVSQNGLDYVHETNITLKELLNSHFSNSFSYKNFRISDVMPYS